MPCDRAQGYLLFFGMKSYGRRYIYRAPKYIYNWKSPYERFFTYLAYRGGVVATARKPQQAHLRVFGCKAFALTRDAQ